MNKLILFLLCVFSLTNTKAIANQSLQQNKSKTFTEYCQQKSILPQATKDTVEVLLKEAGTQNCQQANRKLSNLTRLSLWGSDKEISDLKPLSGFTNLTYLSIWGNQISDIKPLSGLTNLTDLNLAGNQISDIKPLSSLTNLTNLNLWKNQISDIKPLSNLTNLTTLDIDSNQISDIKSLSSLTKLEELRIQANPLQNKTCPLKQESVCKF